VNTPSALTDAEREALLRAGAALSAAITEFAQALLPAVQAAARQLTAHLEALKTAGLLDTNGKPARRTDRPAWQSPYGPPTKR
jgi:ribosomal protein S12 methylthiotransferase accessory factor YcaO